LNFAANSSIFLDVPLRNSSSFLTSFVLSESTASGFLPAAASISANVFPPSAPAADEPAVLKNAISLIHGPYFPRKVLAGEAMFPAHTGVPMMTMSYFAGSLVGMRIGGCIFLIASRPERRKPNTPLLLLGSVISSISHFKNPATAFATFSVVPDIE